MKPRKLPTSLVPNLVLLGIEAQQVITLRCVRVLAGGADAQQELLMMASEKVHAGVDALLHLARGRSLNSVVDDYRQIVQANIARLSTGGDRSGSIAPS